MNVLTEDEIRDILNDKLENISLPVKVGWLDLCWLDSFPRWQSLRPNNSKQGVEYWSLKSKNWAVLNCPKKSQSLPAYRGDRCKQLFHIYNIMYAYSFENLNDESSFLLS